MVGLYKDPKGKRIFDKSKKSVNSTNSQIKTVEDLKKRVTELEAIVATTEVSDA